MKKYLLGILVSVSLSCLGQELNVDMLKAPASPAASLLSLSNTDINKPADVSNLMLGLQNLASVITKEDGGYAIDFSPYWLMPGRKKDKTIGQMLNDNPAVTIPQTLVLSFAVRTTDSTVGPLPSNSLYSGIGFRFSIFRGKPNDATNLQYKLIKQRLSARLPDIAKINSEVFKDSTVQALIKQRQAVEEGSAEHTRLNKLVNERVNTLREEKIKIDKALAENTEEIKALQGKFQINREGILWDVAGGSSIRFRNRYIGNSAIYNAGIWTVLGYTIPKAGTPLLLVRYMFNPEAEWLTNSGFEKSGDFSTLDMGLKYQFSPQNSKFTGGLEGIYRSFVTGADLNPSWKLLANANYSVWPNQVLTFTFGKDFDNHIVKQGNVIAVLSFLSGIGTKRKID